MSLWMEAFILSLDDRIDADLSSDIHMIVQSSFIYKFLSDLVALHIEMISLPDKK